MRCANANECFEHIGAYFNGDKMGYFLIVNTENYDIYQEILQRFEADGSKECIYVSENCYSNGLPDIDTAISKAAGNGNYVLIGLSQALMLRSGSVLEEKLNETLSRSISGRGAVLLDHCEHVLHKFIRRDIRTKDRIVLIDGDVSELPRIKLAENETECIYSHPLPDFSSLLYSLERLTEDKLKRCPDITVISAVSPNMFQNAVYSVAPSDGIYELLINKYKDIYGSTDKSYGTDEQWNWLISEMKENNNFSSLVCEKFGSTVNLSSYISDVMESDDKNKQWLLWLSMKVFGEVSNGYITMALENCNTFESFEEHIYMDIADIGVDDPDFQQYYYERKRLLEKFPENLPLIEKYREKLGIRQKDAIFYLTDGSESEKFDFVRCLSIYEYTDDEIKRAVRSMSNALYMYMQDFIFDSVNTKLPESDNDLRRDLTDYFREYKFQKLKNRIDPEFLETVDRYAMSRPYNKLQSRSSIISHMDRTDMQVFFFDALGVEYLAFISAKCEEYGLVSEVSVGRCELPSITDKNKEFLQYFTDENCYKIEKLDEIKHHSQKYNYQKCEYPLHIFEELDVIDEQIRKIRSMLVQGIIKKALIVSDHGASRLAVRYGHETEAKIKLDESGEYGGRCCKSDENPQIPFAAYEDGFSILANYERFRGGRRANVEVHGGASLEEVLVPIIILTKRLDNIEIRFIDSVITLKPRVAPELILYSNIPFEKPRLFIDGDFYDGEFLADKNHAKFIIPKIKRKGSYAADVYDGDKNMSVTLEFEAQKQTREVELF